MGSAIRGIRDWFNMLSPITEIRITCPAKLCGAGIREIRDKKRLVVKSLGRIGHLSNTEMVHSTDARGTDLR
jgi:hypothetical protein